MTPSRFRRVPKRDRVCRKLSGMQLRTASENFSPVDGVRSKRFSVWALVQLM
jgi:hypothetical protein